MLAEEMHAPSATDGDSSVPAGMTYFGQFIVHDISFGSTSSATGVIDPRVTTNLRSPRLDLDSVYGRGPIDQPYLYERVVRRDRPGPKLLFGHRLNPADLARDTAGAVTGRALIGDPRNDDNLIVSQLHLAFIRFHNAVVDRLAARVAADDLFRAAREEVLRHYHWLILHELLPVITDPAVLRGAMTTPCNEFCDSRGPYIPLELAMAAMRFGHSMVRPTYVISPGRVASLERIRHEFTFRNPLSAGVPPGWEVDWRNFFWKSGARPADANLARRIDPHITAGMPAEFDLLRAYALRVPSGQCVAASLKLPMLTRDQLLGGRPATVLREHSDLLLQRTPLWYYILREAEVHAGGERLGPLGSRLVADLLINLVRAEPGSILSANQWQPTLGPRPGEFTMVHFLCFGGSVSPCR